MGCSRFRLYVCDDSLGAFNMLSLLVIGVISFGVALGVYIIKSKRIKEREQQESDWEYLLKTGDDAGYKRRAKK